VVELPQCLGLAEQLVHVAVEVLAQERLDDHVGLEEAVPAQEGDAEAARPKDALRDELVHGEGSEARRIQPDGLLQFLQRRVPFAPLQGRLVGVVVGLGLRLGVGHELRDGVEILLRRLEVARSDLDLADGVEQSRQLAPAVLGQIPIPAHQLLDQPALLVGAQRQAVGGPDLAVQHIEALLQVDHRPVHVLVLLTLPALLLHQVQHLLVRGRDHHLYVGQNALQLPGLLDEGAVQRVEGGLLGLLQRFQLRKGKALEQGRILFHRPAEEVAGGDNQQRLAVLRPQRDERAEVGVVALPQLVAHLLQRLELGIEQPLRVGEAGEGPRPPGQLVRVEVAFLQDTGLLRGPQLLQALLAEGVLALQFGQGAGIQKRLDLLAKRLFLTRSEQQFAAVPDGIAGQRDLERLPRSRSTPLQGGLEAPALIDEVASQELRGIGDGRLAHRHAEGLAGPADELAQRQGAQVCHHDHGRSPCIGSGGIISTSAWACKDSREVLNASSPPAFRPRFFGGRRRFFARHGETLTPSRWRR
jgi:hypothetical protein